MQLQRVERFLRLQLGGQIVDGARVRRNAGDLLLHRARRVRAVQRAPRAAQTAPGTGPLDGPGRAHAPHHRRRRSLDDGRRSGRGRGLDHRRDHFHRGGRFLDAVRTAAASEAARPLGQLGLSHRGLDGRLERVRFPQRGRDGSAATHGVVTPAAVGPRYRLRHKFFRLEVTGRGLLTQRLGRHQTYRFFKTREKKKKTIIII